MNNKNDEVPGSSPQSIKKDILLFKNDILKDMRTIQKSLDSKYIKVDENLNTKINKFSEKISLLEQKIFELSNKINTDNKIRKEVELLNQFKEETSNTIFKRRVKYNDFEKRMNDEINRFNDILTDSVIYPSIIGNNTRFKTFHEFMDYVLEEIGQFKIYKDKSGLDMGPFKKKIDQSLDAIRIQMNNIGSVSKEFTTSSITQSEEKIKSILAIYDDKLQDFRVENARYLKNFEKKLEEFNNDINKFKKILDNNYFKDTLKHHNSEIILINSKINKMNNLIKELLDNFNPINRTATKNEKRPKIYSGVKQYINGMLNANELSAMKNFKKFEDSSFGKDIKRSTTEFKKRNNYLKNDTSKINNIKEYTFLSKNAQNYLNSLNSEITDESNKKSEGNIPVVRDIYHAMNYNDKKNNNNLSRRMSFNINTLNTFKNLKLNDENENKKIIANRNKEIIEKASNDKTRNSLKFINSSSSSNDSKKESIFNISKDSKDNDILSDKSTTKDPFIIKEEDENNMSENSFFKNKEENKNKDINKEKNENEENKNKELDRNKDIKNKIKEISIDIVKDNKNNKITTKDNKDNIKNKDIIKDNKNKDLFKDNNDIKNNKIIIDNKENKENKNNKDVIKDNKDNINKKNITDNKDKKSIIDNKNNKDKKNIIDNKDNNNNNNINTFKKDNINAKKIEINNYEEKKIYNNNQKINYSQYNIKTYNNNNNNSPPKIERKMNSLSDNHSYKFGLNTLRKTNYENKNVPILELIKFGQIDNNVRSQSSKKRNNKTSSLFYKNINEDYYKYNKKDTGNINIFNSYNNVHMNTNTNFQTNKAYHNFPNINKEIIRQKLESIPNTDVSKTKLIKFSNINNMSQTYKTNKNSSGNRPKRLVLGSPENVFSNVIAAKKNKKIMKNKSFGIGNERTNEAKEIENMLNKLHSYIPNYEPNLPQDEIGRSFKGLKPYKNSNK